MNGGTADILKISWSDGTCWTLTPSEGLWNGKTIQLTVRCDRNPASIRVETHRGGYDQTNIDQIVVDEPVEEKLTADSTMTTRTRRTTLCVADFEKTWLKAVLEKPCVYESIEW